ncbi:hypothetical protein [Bartonella tamiae]|uniref:Organic solvent tolerance-like N-terminal domain-containing protein n=1 Tax=Bartonella tamiae Th239 TaxID=1094558 RepID=J0R0I4_9HYPH|nr:hypothetical protein [Bartonella tamiae]EJF89019.1 hypothetical protein ME5_01570 [Bartonella tamiae Th239]EJF94731.1 hypothetical protein MEG_00312 [Bartonella tamiae Th307]
MIKYLIISASLLLLFTTIQTNAATLVNSDTETQTLIITEGSSRRDVLLKTDQKVDICSKGCFITFPNGDRFAIKAEDNISIIRGRARFQ